MSEKDQIYDSLIKNMAKELRSVFLKYFREIYQKQVNVKS
jgi:hypothetical protein